jgi:uncharacterized protein YceK
VRTLLSNVAHQRRCRRSKEAAKRSRLFASIAAAVCALALPGCGTFLYFVSPARGPGLKSVPFGAVYCGTAADFYYIVHGPGGARLLCLFDIPFSLLLDTALLPLTIPGQIAFTLTHPPDPAEQNGICCLKVGSVTVACHCSPNGALPPGACAEGSRCHCSSDCCADANSND